MQTGPFLRRATDGYAHWCPACEELHHIGDSWKFNGNLYGPTFSPSVRVSSGHFIPGHKGDCWCNFTERTGIVSSFKCGVCHYFLEGGLLKYCPDSTHALAGKTVELPPLPEEYRDPQAPLASGQ